MRAAIGVGSNRGDRAAAIACGRMALMADGLVRVVAAAPLITTAPVGGPRGQEPYANGAWIVETGLGPHGLLLRLLAAETAAGRVRTVRDGPRTLDLDLLLIDDGRTVATPVLTVPHPRLHLRAFALVPLAAIAGGWRHPLGRVDALAAAVLAATTPPGSRQA
jgi:2-amino-4-hydroxy-6-hydroxymethyldihydropteridine diphosphokinase